jgi:hypothetical protein
MTLIEHDTDETAHHGAACVLCVGALAGVVGGVLMGLWGMIAGAASGQGPLAQLKLIGATFVGVDALVGGPGFVVWGLCLHLLVSAGWGVVFALVVGRDAAQSFALVVGLLFGVAVLAIMTFLVLPAADPILRQRVPMMRGSWIVQHVLYGVGVAMFPLWRRLLMRRADMERLRSFDRQHARGGPPPAVPPL